MHVHAWKQQHINEQESQDVTTYLATASATPI